MDYDSMAGVQERHRLVINDGHPRTQRRRGLKTSPNQHSPLWTISDRLSGEPAWSASPQLQLSGTVLRFQVGVVLTFENKKRAGGRLFLSRVQC
jgi:hypothetical protein